MTDYSLVGTSCSRNEVAFSKFSGEVRMLLSFAMSGIYFILVWKERLTLAWPLVPVFHFFGIDNVFFCLCFFVASSMGERQNERNWRDQTRDRREPSGSWSAQFWAPGTGNKAQGLYHVMCMGALIGNQSGRTRFMFLVLSRCHSVNWLSLLVRQNDRIMIHIYSFMNSCELN